MSWKPETIAAGRSPFLKVRLASLIAAQFFDFGTFALMIWHRGVGAEANPIVAHGFTGYGWPLIAVSKVALVVLVGAVIVMLDRRDRRHPGSFGLSAAVALFGVLAGLIGGITNTLGLPVFP